MFFVCPVLVEITFSFEHWVIYPFPTFFSGALSQILWGVMTFFLVGDTPVSIRIFEVCCLWEGLTSCYWQLEDTVEGHQKAFTWKNGPQNLENNRMLRLFYGVGQPPGMLVTLVFHNNPTYWQYHFYPIFMDGKSKETFWSSLDM